MDPGDDFRPSSETSPRPILKTRNGIPFLPYLADVRAPLVRPHHLLPPPAEITPEPPLPPPLQFELLPDRFFPTPRL
jgi:hypothetical protein